MLNSVFNLSQARHLRSIFSIGLVLALGQASLAGQQSEIRYLDSEYALFVQNSELQARAKESLVEYFRHLQFSVDHFDVQTEPLVQLKKVDIDILPKSFKVEEREDGLFVHSSNNSVRIAVGEVKVDQIIERVINGVIVRIRVQASCRGVSATLSDSDSIVEGTIRPVIDGEWLKLKLSDPVVRLGKPEFEMSSLKCEGAQGFGEYLEKTIRETLVQTQVFNQKIQNEYLVHLNKTLDQWGYQWKKPQLIFSDNRFEGWIFPAMIEKVDQLWRSNGILRVGLKGVSHLQQNNNDPEVIKFPNYDFSSYSGTSALVVPDQFVLAIIKTYFHPDVWKFAAQSNEIPEFQSLMKSRLKQIFVWADLLNFSRKTNFQFTGLIKADPQLQWTSPQSFYLGMNFHLDMSFLENGVNVPYIHFDINAQSQMSFNIENEQLVLQSNNPHIQLRYQWNEEYCERPGTCGHIWKGMLSKAATSYLNGRKFLFALPKLESLGNVRLTPSQVMSAPNLGHFIFKLAP